MDKHEIGARFNSNLERVRNLVSIYETKLTPVGQGRRPVSSADLLRAAVVLLHATMEDLIRSISMGLLPCQGSMILDKIPLAGISHHGRAEKFLLGRLTDFRGKTVDEVIAVSVEGFMERSNYNDPDQLLAAITNVGLSIDSVRPLLSTLEEMMLRRHWIVHRADHNPEAGQGQHKAKSIGIKQVNRWIAAVEGLERALLGQLP